MLTHNYNTKSSKSQFRYWFIGSVLTIFIAQSISASILSEARKLRKISERESKNIKISVLNFGDKSDKSDFNKALRMIKIGKIKLAQNKYSEAKTNYKNYLKLQNSIYASLAKKYMERTQKIIDDVAVDLVDFLDNQKINKYFKMASQHYNDAKRTMTRKQYKIVIGDCRRSKEYMFGAFKVAGKKLPVKYIVDSTDIKKKIYKKATK